MGWDPFAKLTAITAGVGPAVRAFELANPNEPVLAAGACKGLLLSTPEEVTRGPKWILARRGVLIATANELFCDDWVIPYEQVERLSYLEFRGLSRAMVLKVWLRDGRQYQFGMNYDPRWVADLPLKADQETGRISYSVFSVVLRVGVLAYLLWEVVGWRVLDAERGNAGPGDWRLDFAEIVNQFAISAESSRGVPCPGALGNPSRG